MLRRTEAQAVKWKTHDVDATLSIVAQSTHKGKQDALNTPARFWPRAMVRLAPALSPSLLHNGISSPAQCVR